MKHFAQLVLSRFNHLSSIRFPQNPKHILALSFVGGFLIALMGTTTIPTRFPIKNLTNTDWIKGIHRTSPQVLIDAQDPWIANMLRERGDITLGGDQKRIVVNVTDTKDGLVLDLNHPLADKENIGHPHSIVLTNIKENSFIKQIAINTFFATILLSTLFFFLKYKNFYLLLIPLIIFGSAVAVSHRVYSIIDEAAHFEYILRILFAKQLPTLHAEDIWLFQLLERNPAFHGVGIPIMKNYEAVQPPLYYLVTAIALSPLYLLTKDPTVLLYAARVFGVCLLSCSFVLVVKTYKLLTKRSIIPSFHALFFSLLCVGFFSQKVLSILIPVSNEHLTFLLYTIGLYLLARISTEAFSKKLYGAIILTGILLFYTKFTAVFFLPLCAAVLWHRYGFRRAFLYGCAIMISALPYFIYNYLQYGDPTGAKKHIEFVLPIVNPQNESYDFSFVLRSVVRVFQDGIFVPHAQDNSVRALGLFISSLLFLSVIGVWVFLISKRKIPLLVFWFSIVSTTVFLIYSTMSTNIMAILERYWFMNLAALLIVLYYFITVIFRKKGYLLVSAVCLVFMFFSVWEYLLIPFTSLIGLLWQG